MGLNSGTKHRCDPQSTGYIVLVDPDGTFSLLAPLSLADSPDDLVSLDDLERIGVPGTCIAAVEELHVRRPLGVLGPGRIAAETTAFSPFE